MKLRHLLLGAGLVFAGGLALLGDRNSGVALSEPAKPAIPVARTSAPAGITRGDQATSDKRTASSITTAPRGTGLASGTVLPLRERQQLIGRDDMTTTSILFSSHSWMPLPSPSPVPEAPPPPAAPPLPFKYLGKLKETDHWQVFLARDDATFIVKENDVIESQYRIQRIDPPLMTLLYLPLNQTQSLTIE